MIPMISKEIIENAEYFEIHKQIRKHASETAPEECCGVITTVDNAMTYIRLKNVSDTPRRAFLIDPKAIENIENISHIVHSHLGESSKPSDEDRISCDRCGIPFLIISNKTGEVTVCEPNEMGDLPLVGRRFLYPTSDCFAVVKDYFRQTQSIEIAEQPRLEFGWWNDEKNAGHFEEGFVQEGAYEIDKDGPLKVGDVIIMKIDAKVPNHFAVYVGTNAMLHHVFGGKSLIEIYGEYWRANTIKIMRLKRMDEKSV